MRLQRQLSHAGSCNTLAWPLWSWHTIAPAFARVLCCIEWLCSDTVVAWASASS